MQVGLRDGGVRSDEHLGHQGEPVLAGVERSQVGRQALGQHRKKVERVVVVDRTPGQRREVPDLRVGVPARAGDRGQLLLDAGRKLRLQSARGHRFGGNADKVGSGSTMCGGIG